MKVTWSPLALERVAEIGGWIAEDRPDAAARVVEEIFAAVERLVDFPESGRVVPEFGRPDLREIVTPPFTPYSCWTRTTSTGSPFLSAVRAPGRRRV